MAQQKAKGLYEEIRKDHENIRALLEKLRRTSMNQSVKRKGYLAALREKLEPHMRAEEHVIYPALTVDEETGEDALDAAEEHHIAQILLDELELLPVTDEHWGAKLRVLKEVVLRHLDEEEDRIFDDIREVVPSSREQEMLKEFMDAKMGALYAVVKPVEQF